MPRQPCIPFPPVSHDFSSSRFSKIPSLALLSARSVYGTQILRWWRLTAVGDRSGRSVKIPGNHNLTNRIRCRYIFARAGVDPAARLDADLYDAKILLGLVKEYLAYPHSRSYRRRQDGSMQELPEFFLQFVTGSTKLGGPSDGDSAKDNCNCLSCVIK